jgi:ferrous iron transport protein B
MGLTHRSVGTHAAAFGGTRRTGERIVALAGNPNVGKSTVFNALTGMRQHTGNWAGKTVGCACGRCRSAREQYLLVDLPGTYSLQPHSAEEAVACDFVRGGKADAVVVVCDATCLERTLVLALQMHSVTPNTIVCVNLLDEARRKRIRIDLPALQTQLGMPVVGVTARKKKTLRALLDALDAVMAAPQPRPDGAPEAGDPADDVRRAEVICRAAVRRETPEYAARDRRLDRLLTSRATGYPIMLLGLAGVLWLTIAGANAPSEWLAHFFGWAQGKFSALLIFLHAPPWLQGLLVDGMFRTLAWVVAVMLPPMAIFFPLFTLLEDAGYLPRVAYNLDRPFQACRACGKQALTMCMGLGCNAAGVVGCRIIDSERERLLAVLTNSLMPCNGRFPALIALMTMFFSLSGSTLTAALLLTAALTLCVGLTFGATWLLSVTVLRGKPSAFALELPPYRAPQVGQVLVRSVFDRTLFVLGRAAAVAAPAGMVLWALANAHPGGVSLLTRCAAALNPLGQVMGMDGVLLLAFVLGFPANEIVLPIAVMGYLAQGSLSDALGLAQMHALLTANGWTWTTAVSAVLFFLLHWPCSTTLWTIRRETGSAKWTLLAALLPTALGMALCAAFTALARLLGW